MSIKILDSCSAINLLERLRCYDCSEFLGRYRTILTDDVRKETSFGTENRSKSFEPYDLSPDEIEFSEWINDSIMELGPGERSIIAHALFMSNDDSDEGIFLISDDKEARHIFERTLSRSPKIIERFPHLNRITWVRSDDVLRRIMDEGMLDDGMASEIYSELFQVLGPKRLGFLKN